MLNRLHDERGISLLLSLLVMSALSITTVGMITYTSAGSRAAARERSTVSARAFAEAGLNNALSIIAPPAANPTVQALLPLPGTTARTFTFSGGRADVWGRYTAATDDGLWTLTSTGTVANPSGGAPVKRTLTQSVIVHGLVHGVPGDWNRMTHGDPSPGNCLEIEDVTIPTPVRSGGCITLKGSAKVTGATTTVDAGTNVTLVDGSGSPALEPSQASGWTNSTRVYSSDNSYATNANIPVSTTGATLNVTDFGFLLPTGANVTGILVAIERSASNASATVSLRDETVQLLRANAAVGTNKANTGVNWGTSETTANYGAVTGTLDTWNVAPALTAADVNNAGFGVRIRVRNGTTSTRTASIDSVRITVSWVKPTTASIGLSGQNVAQTNIGGSCKYLTQAAHTPCSATDRVYATTYSPTLPEVVQPDVDMEYWYRHAKPGPAYPCDNAGGSFVSGFDNDYNPAIAVPNNSLQTTWPTYPSAEVTPPGFNYTCQVHDANGGLVGEISWNRTTRVLKIKGTIFIDGDFRFDDDGSVVHYQGRGIIYASGNLEFDEMVCAGGQYPDNCFGTLLPNGQGSTMSNWDPTQNMMTVLSGGWSEFDQGSTQAQATPSGLQGLIYSDGECLVHQWFHLSGPILCGSIELPTEPFGWPVYYTWPDITALTQGQKYRSVSDATEFELDPGPITG